MRIFFEKIQEKMEKQTISITESFTQNITLQMAENFKRLDEHNQQLHVEVSELKEKSKD